MGPYLLQPQYSSRIALVNKVTIGILADHIYREGLRAARNRERGNPGRGHVIPWLQWRVWEPSTQIS